MASGDAVERIKERLTIEEVVAPYVELHRAGKSLKGKSPFTPEKTPSFYVSPDKGMYYCFSSNQGGDMFTFIQAMEGVDFKGALKLLAEKAGIELVPEDPKKRSERETRYAVLDAATKFYEDTLAGSPVPQRYLTERGVSDKTRTIWRIGYAPNAWRAVKHELEEKKFSEPVLRAVGLVKGEEGKEGYDVFRDRILFPICDASGRVVGFSGRTLSKDTETPKYVNSPETELFNKSQILFGYDKARQGIRKFDFSLIVEGQFDVVLAHQAGYNNAVAVSGTALTNQHVDLLSRLSHRVVLALDADRAGLSAIKRAAALMLPRGMDVKVARLPEGKDPADIVKEDIEQFRKLIGHSVHVIEHLLTIYKETSRDERAMKIAVREEVLPLIAVIPSAIDREHFEGVVAERLSTTKEGVHLEVAGITERLEHQAARSANEAPPAPSPEKSTPTEATSGKLPTTAKVDEHRLHLEAILMVRTFSEEASTADIEALRQGYERVLKNHAAELELVPIEEVARTQYQKRMAQVAARLRDMSQKEFHDYFEDGLVKLLTAVCDAQVARVKQIDLEPSERTAALQEWFRTKTAAPTLVHEAL